MSTPVDFNKLFTFNIKPKETLNKSFQNNTFIKSIDKSK